MLKRFIKYYGPHKGLLSLDLFCAIAVAACNLFYPYIAKEIINVHVPAGAWQSIIIASGLLLGVYLLKCVCNYVMGYYGHVIGVRMQKDMRRDLFSKYEKLPFSYFDSHKTGDLLSRLVNDLFDVSELAHHGPENLLLATLMFVGSFIILSTINIWLTLIMFAVAPFIVLFTVLSRKRMRAAMKASRKQMSAINSSLENSLGGIRETKAYANEKHEMQRFDVSNGLYAHYRQQAMRYLGGYDAIMHLLQDVLYLAVILAGGLFLYKGWINEGEFAAFLLYIGMFLTPIQRFVALFQQLQEGMTGFARFHEIMNEDDEIDNGKEELSDVKGEVVFDNVTFSYEADESAKSVIKNLSLKVEAGKTVALVGPSGGGKTTLCNLIPRFYRVNSGAITLDGVNIEDVTLPSLRSNIGIVSQTVFLFDGTVRENITYGKSDATEEEIIEAAKRANIHDFVTSLEDGYDTEVGERGVKLSGGQRQRIAIARVFLKNPKLLILDEATSALDNATEMQVQSALEELSEGRTVIVVAHRLSTVKNADEIIVIGEEGIIEKGTHDELLAKNGEYHKLYSYQFKNM